MFFDKPIDLLIAPGIYSEHLNDDVLDRTLNAVCRFIIQMNLKSKRV
ncbi:DUF4277 domain-containing protein [Thorsellia kenyensis]|uniref:DUF4277 domain-containing protein n=1 Tax=Thorsellia kenyensis TaxID=1549888 RepID=A0ABV6C6P8_9GAMM